jgi:hypothetical protein
MAGYSRREFIKKSSVYGLGLTGTAGMLSFSENDSTNVNVDTETGPTKIVDS